MGDVRCRSALKASNSYDFESNLREELHNVTITSQAVEQLKWPKETAFLYSSAYVLVGSKDLGISQTLRQSGL